MMDLYILEWLNLQIYYIKTNDNLSKEMFADPRKLNIYD